jgi:5-methylcytosine-specific restriction endonuclease McrA
VSVNRWGDRASQRLAKAVLRRDGYRCQIRLPGCKGMATQADHIMPKSKGGSHDMSNLRAACGWCNARKHARTDVLPQMTAPARPSREW